MIPARLSGASDAQSRPVGGNPRARLSSKIRTEIRRTLARYAAVVEEQHRQLMERRHAMLGGDAQPDIWQIAPERQEALVAAVGDTAVVAA